MLMPLVSLVVLQVRVNLVSDFTMQNIIIWIITELLQALVTQDLDNLELQDKTCMIRCCQNIIFEKILKIQIQSDEESQSGGKSSVKGDKFKFKRKDRKGFIPTRKMMQKSLKGRAKAPKVSSDNLGQKLKKIES